MNIRASSIPTIKKVLPIIGVVFLFAAYVFSRFYQLESRATVGWDQMDNAWAAVRILRNHTYPLVGMMAKFNSGIVIGPLYYYLVALFYAFTRYDPIAAPMLAGCTGIIAFWTMYAVVQRIHGTTAAVFALLLYTFSYTYVITDRVQWPVNFIPILSFIIFYALYRALTDAPKYLILAGAVVGLSFHIHFTSVFYIPIVIACFPLLPRTKQVMSSALIAFGIFLVLLTPQLIYEMQRLHGSTGEPVLRYLTSYNHGFHLRRFLQISHDAFIEIERVLNFRFLRPFVFAVPFLYALLLWLQKNTSWRVIVYLMFLWIIVPWIAFTLYSGEISSYYFSITLPIALLAVSYILAHLWQRNILPVRLMIVAVFLFYMFVNGQRFFQDSGENTLAKARAEAKLHIFLDNPIPYKEGDVPSYLYYMYTTLAKVPKKD